VASLAEATDLTPMEWLARLGKKLLARQELVRFWMRYYEGDADLPAGPNQHREVFNRFQRLARTNLCLLCAESRVHRTRAIGFRDPGWKSISEIDPVWKLWQAAKLDARQAYIWRKAYSLSAAYVTAGADPRRAKTPRVTIEGPENVIVEHDPADSSRILAALRLWHDDIARRWMATLYLPGEKEGQRGTRYAWRTKQQTGRGPLVGGISWKPAMWEERAEPAVSTSQVPVVPFYNGDEGVEPFPSFAPGIDAQNRLNLTLLNRLTSERYAAFRQTVLLNYEIEEDPVTGEPIAPWKPGVTQIGMVGPPDDPSQPAVQLVQLQQTDTSQMLRAVESDMRSFAAITLTPVYYLPGDINNLGAEAVAALDAGHNAEITQGNAGRAEGLEAVLQLMADIAELDRDLSQSEVVFARPENFNPAQVGDLLSKYVGAGIPLPIATAEVGWSPQQVDALRSELAADALRASMREPETAPTGARPAATEPAQAVGAPREPAGSHDLG
jgi:hypothetical protein